MVVTGPNDAGVAAPVEIRREAATVIERDAAGNEIGSSSTKIERQNMEIDAVTVTDETKTKTATDTYSTAVLPYKHRHVVKCPICDDYATDNSIVPARLTGAAVVPAAEAHDAGLWHFGQFIAIFKN